MEKNITIQCTYEKEYHYSMYWRRISLLNVDMEKTITTLCTPGEEHHYSM